MKVNDSISTSLTSTETSGTKETARTGQSSAPGSTTGSTQTAGTSSTDDVHLSELVKSLRSMAADSPERQAKLESLARSYANGSHEVDAGATASKIIDDSFKG
jgi:flagellar biosynthesis anti-sigma factor FlgM